MGWDLVGLQSEVNGPQERSRAAGAVNGSQKIEGQMLMVAVGVRFPAKGDDHFHFSWMESTRVI